MTDLLYPLAGILALAGYLALVVYLGEASKKRRGRK